MEFFHRAKKSLGQNFLKDKRYLRKVVDTAGLNSTDVVLEIGPGKGDLTSFLLETGAKIIAVEYDPDLYTFLQEKFATAVADGSLTLINKDILEFSPEEAGLTKNYVIVANIPYNITGAILRYFLSNKHQPNAMTLILQKEVAERIVERDGKTSILSLSVAAYGKATYAGKIPAQAFSPKPKIDSGILHIKDISRDNFISKDHEKLFFQLIKAGFQHKRKKLVSNLSLVFGKEAVLALQIGNNSRAEELKLYQWLAVAKVLNQQPRD